MSSKKFKFKTRGKLTKAEEEEKRRTHGGGAFDWLRKTDHQKSKEMTLEERLEWENEIGKELNEINNIEFGTEVVNRNGNGIGNGLEVTIVSTRGGCVNTQTDSESNTLNTRALQRSGSVNTQTGSGSNILI